MSGESAGDRLNIRTAYDEWSATYDADRNLTRDLDHQVTRQILRQLQFRSVLEIGCGTGKNTALLAQIGAHVHGIDFSDGMISRARENVRQGNVEFTVADVTQAWPCGDGAVDLVTCNLVLEHIADLGFVFAEASRCLSDGGRLFICELHPFRQYEGKRAEYHRNGQTGTVPAYVHHVSDFSRAANKSGFSLESFDEWWHDEDDRDTSPPRLVSMMFRKPRSQR